MYKTIRFSYHNMLAMFLWQHIQYNFHISISNYQQSFRIPIFDKDKNYRKTLFDVFTVQWVKLLVHNANYAKY